jgi:hypothetical protein
LERDVSLGPFFTLGVVLVGVAARRRSWLLAGVGVAAIVADQRLPLARRLKERIRALGDERVAIAGQDEVGGTWQCANPRAFEGPPLRLE